MTAGEPSVPRIAYVALGSNMGDRAAHLAFGRTRMAALPGTRLLRASRIEETAPLGPVAQGPYLNQMVALATTLAPEALLDALHAIERDAGRERRERWGPRTLDLDIVLVEGVESAADGLQLPHPGLRARDFWQRELDELRSIAMSDSSFVSDAAGSVELPAWAVVSPKRRAHIERVTALLASWADAMSLGADERRAWYDAGRYHDALRDADEATLRALVPDTRFALPMLHGPAAAVMLEREGETRRSVLDAIRYHTIGSPDWDRTGRALFMADFLEPGRGFGQEERARLAARVPDDFDGVLRDVVRHRIEWTMREGRSLYPECVGLWNSVR